MGVGAVFISSLALTRLPTPHDPPENQQEILAASLQPIVSFVVLGSILIRMLNIILFYVYAHSCLDGLSIPFCSFGQKVHSRTVSLSHTITTRSRNDAPDWLLWARRPASSPPDTGRSPVTSLDIERQPIETSLSNPAVEPVIVRDAIVESNTSSAVDVRFKTPVSSEANDVSV